MNKILWMSWLQGTDHMSLPALNKTCLDGWKTMNPDWDVKVITYQNLLENLPEFKTIMNNANYKRRHKRNVCDLIRLMLLYNHGGVWADASVLPMKPLTKIVKETVNDTGFFSYRYFPRCKSHETPFRNRGKSQSGAREIDTWFLVAAEPRHYLITKWLELFKHNFLNKHRWDIYYQFNQDLCDLYDSNITIRELVNNMVQLNTTGPHSAMKNETIDWTTKEYMLKRPPWKQNYIDKYRTILKCYE